MKYPPIDEKLIYTNTKRVFKYQLDKQNVYIKKAAKPQKALLRKLQRLIYKLTKHPIFYPTVENVKLNLTLVETQKLQILKTAGLNVPSVLYIGKDYFIMSDTGIGLENILAQQTDLKFRNDLLNKALSQLRKLHQNGFAHGGAQYRNFTLLNKEVCLIDFEESIPEQHLAFFQLRDLLLFIFSLEKAGFDPDIQEICAIYDENETAPTFSKIQELFASLGFLKIIKNSFLKNIKNRDMVIALNLIEKLEEKK